jgi:ATP phosphoribosyltransferase regulatory subunit
VKIIDESMTPEERLPIELRALYRQYGYQIYQMSDFESYDLYRENKNFLSDNMVLTFTDIDGELMALKPDITLSIAKGIKPEDTVKKLFYAEHVFRPRRSCDKFSEIEQMGLEYIGADSAYAEAEVVYLAALSLQAISEDYFLGLSHMVYVSSLLDALSVTAAQSESLFDAIRRKSMGDILLALEGINLSPAQSAALSTLVDLPTDTAAAIKIMRDNCLNQGMTAAVLELKSLIASLEQWGIGSRIRIDLSLLNDLEYYTGIVFQGYIKGIPRAVLSGGRYDGLLQRFGRNLSALGFALYLNEIYAAINKSTDFDVDTLLLYDEQPVADIIHAVNALTARGISVRVASDHPQGLRAKRTVRLADLLKEVDAPC